MEHKAYQISLGNRFALASLKVDVKKLKWLMGRGPGEVTPKLDKTFEPGREGNIYSSEVPEDRGRV